MKQEDNGVIFQSPAVWREHSQWKPILNDFSPFEEKNQQFYANFGSKIENQQSDPEINTKIEAIAKHLASDIFQSLFSNIQPDYGRSTHTASVPARHPVASMTSSGFRLNKITHGAHIAKPLARTGGKYRLPRDLPGGFNGI